MFSPDFYISKSNKSGTVSIFEIILKIGKSKSVAKGTALIKEGSHSHFFFYIQKGIFKSVAKVNDKEYVLGFTFADDIDCCPTALLSGLPNNFTIEALEDSEVLICEMKDFEKFSPKEDYYSIINNLLVYYLSFIEKRLIDAISLNAEQRYRMLLQQQPVKIKQIPLTLIASYLGISLERLSRIRKKMKV